ncbi:hemicentin-2 isoform X2 [Fundulus heteroclitus]|uniref:hemicentin-2 isoform X2 n=1 Tax=Fundulus heteroclitus TaxID=8078 RepID=UPI00165CA73D|nr:hemicentin-2 isoform X2 [Fundulus heteroclitus]
MKVVGLLMVLLRVSCSVETYCDGRQDKAQCFGALGGTVALQLMDKDSEIPKYKWMKEASKNESTLTILYYYQTYNVTSNSMSSRSVFFPGNGTFKINNLSRSDTGEYSLRMFDSNGKQIRNRTLQVSIEAPLSSVHMTSECVSHGLIRVSCLSEGGDSPQYTWSLNGNKTRNTEIVERNTENNIIILRQNTSGYLVCTVKNHISRVSKEGMIPVCKDEETRCNISEDGAGCYGALRGTVVIQLMKNTSETPKYEWKNKTSTILRGSRNNYFPDTLKERFLFIPMYGTFSIMNLSRADSGQYTLETFDSDGKNIEKKTLQLIVQAPVSSVQLVLECLSQGEMKVSCLSEGGDSPQYNWTLDGHTLTDSELFPENHETNVIVLRQNISGRLVCSVWNRFSFLSTEKTISTWGCTFINCTSNGTQISGWVLTENNILCVESVIALGMVMTSVLLPLVFFLAVAIGFICAKKKRHTYKVEKDNSEPVYAEIRVVPQQERHTEETVEEEVDYKQVTFSELPQQTVQAEHPVYAQICKVR